MNPRKDFELKMQLLLETIILLDELPELSDSETIILKECSDCGYVENVEVLTMADGSLNADYSSVRVTKKGLDFLYPKRGTAENIQTVALVLSALLNIILLFS